MVSEKEKKKEKRRRKDRKKKFFQIYMGSFGFSFKLIIFVFWKSMQILFTDRALPTIRHMDQILGGKVSLLPYLD